MSFRQTLLLTAVLGAILIAAALIIRSGLVSIAAAVRDKPLPSMPESVAIRDLTIRQATVDLPRTQGTNHNVNVRIENMRIDTQNPMGVVK